MTQTATPTTAASFTSTYKIKVNGQDLSQDRLDQVGDIAVDQSLYRPDAFSVTFHDPAMNLTDQDIMPIGAEVEIWLGREDEPAKVFAGEVTAHTLDVSYGDPPTYMVRGYDRGHRLQRGRQSRSFLNMTDSDIASKLARDAGLRADVDSTSQVYTYVLQNNETNWEFLQERAARIGYVAYVEGTTLHFNQPKPDDSPALSTELWQDALHTQVHMSSAGQVDKVTVLGWDVQNQQAITGQATGGAATAGGGEQKSGAALARPFGSASMVVTRYPVRSQGEADKLAKSLIDDLSGNAVQMEAALTGKPALRPGQVVTIEALGQRFSGHYYVTNARHSYGKGQEYTTAVTVSGRRSGSLLELVAGAGGSRTNGYGAGGIAIAKVTNNKDDKGLGRVKVKFPWLQDSQGEATESDWARIATASGGSGRGFYWLPEVDDEVLVAFEQGDPNTCYVVGGLWNDKDKPPKPNSEVVDGEGKVTQRIIKSRTGHVITIDDSDDKSSIKIVDKSGNNTFTIDSKNNKIILSAEQDLELNAKQNIKISAGQNFSVKANQDCQIEATSNATLKGMMTSVQGDTSCEVKSNTEAKMTGAMVSVEAQANCAVKGAIVQIN